MSNALVFDLKPYAGPENVGELTGEDHKLLQKVTHSSFQVGCPMNKENQAVGLCATCPHFRGLGRVEVHGEADLDRRVRVMCSFPKPRRPMKSTAPMKSDYRKYLDEAIDHFSGQPGRDAALEKSIFIEHQIAVHCPISRAKTGSWRVELPPCPACEHFRGIDLEAGPRVLCAHMFSITLMRSVVGTPALLGD